MGSEASGRRPWTRWIVGAGAARPPAGLLAHLLGRLAAAASAHAALSGARQPWQAERRGAAACPLMARLPASLTVCVLWLQGD